VFAEHQALPMCRTNCIRRRGWCQPEAFQNWATKEEEEEEEEIRTTRSVVCELVTFAVLYASDTVAKPSAANVPTASEPWTSAAGDVSNSIHPSLNRI